MWGVYLTCSVLLANTLGICIKKSQRVGRFVKYSIYTVHLMHVLLSHMKNNVCKALYFIIKVQHYNITLG